VKVLFVSSGGTYNRLSSIIANQALSLRKLDVSVEHFLIKGSGARAYLSHILKLNKHLKSNRYDIVHAHYALSGIVSALSGAKPLIVSLMGSDVLGLSWQRLFSRIFSRFFWDSTIVKSEQMKKTLKGFQVSVIPNGVNMSSFRPLSNLEISKEILTMKKPLLIFIGNPSRKEKNFSLAKQAIDRLKNIELNFLTLSDIKNELISNYMNAASVFVLPSLWEGSPNAVKEAMACNCPVVATDVGDVRWLFGDEPGYFIADFTPEDFAAKIKMALEFSKKHRRTNGRKRIIELGLDSESVARRLIGIYNEVLKR